MIGEFFDPEQDVFNEERLRPHWSQAGAIVFITFRTKDSVPKQVLQQWEQEKIAWLEKRGLLGNYKHWSTVLPTLSDAERQAFQTHFNRTRESFLDTCQGKCLLVRSASQYDYLRMYIADNPTKARLKPGEYLYERKS